MKIGMSIRVKSGNFGHQVNSDIHLQTVEIQMRRLIKVEVQMRRLIKVEIQMRRLLILMSRLIRISTVCLVSLLIITIINILTNKVAVRI